MANLHVKQALNAEAQTAEVCAYAFSVRCLDYLIVSSFVLSDRTMLLLVEHFPS
jgi:hypothetical protein